MSAEYMYTKTSLQMANERFLRPIHSTLKPGTLKLKLNHIIIVIVKKFHYFTIRKYFVVYIVHAVDECALLDFP